MKKFLEKHGYDTLLAVLILVFGGSIIGIFKEVLAAFEAFPVAIAVCCGLSLVLGLGISSLADRKDVKIAQIESNERLEMRIKDAEVDLLEKKAAAEREAKNKEELEKMRLDKLAQRIRKAHGDAKPAIVFLYDNGPVKDAFSYDWRPASSLESDLFEYEPIPGNSAIYDITPDVRKVIDLHPEILEETRKAIEATPSLRWEYPDVDSR